MIVVIVILLSILILIGALMLLILLNVGYDIRHLVKLEQAARDQARGYSLVQHQTPKEEEEE